MPPRKRAAASRLPPTAPAPRTLKRIQRATYARRVGLILLAIFLLLGLTGVLGVRTQHVAAAAGGYELDVTYARVARPGLAAPWVVEIRKPGGFDGPVTLESRSAYFDLFDFAALYPDAESATQTATTLRWQFEPPSGDVLRIALDGRISPGRQIGERGETSILENGRRVVSVRYKTWLAP